MKNFLRTGLIGRKLQMTQIFDHKTGKITPVTIILIEPNLVLSVLDKEKHNSIILSSIKQKPSRLNQALRGLYKKVGVDCQRVIKEFHVVKSSTYSHNILPGAQICVDYFSIGSYVDVSGVTIGKGFAGGMKRHNFAGLEASHGVSISHRSIGSTGQCQDPGKVFKGKKMPGQLGNVKQTIQNLKILDIDKPNNLAIVLGSVPGKRNGILTVRDALKKQ
jgi:large subunit ribosomal protein L3